MIQWDLRISLDMFFVLKCNQQHLKIEPVFIHSMVMLYPIKIYNDWLYFCLSIRFQILKMNTLIMNHSFNHIYDRN
jgi:hypothetical protein